MSLRDKLLAAVALDKATAHDSRYARLSIELARILNNMPFTLRQVDPYHFFALDDTLLLWYPALEVKTRGVWVEVRFAQDLLNALDQGQGLTEEEQALLHRPLSESGRFH